MNAKRIIFYLAVLGIVTAAFTACQEMDSTYKDLIVPGGIIYPGKPVSTIALSGRNRVKIAWLRGSDPSVVKARIFWNNYTDSVEVDIPAGENAISYILEDLPENTYSFFIRTYDTAGHVSVPVEVIGTAYGEHYQASLVDRPINLCSISEQRAITIEWGTVDTTSVYATEVRYTDTAGKEQVRRTLSKEATLVLPDIKQGTAFKYRTVYVPDSAAIDTFYTGFVAYDKYFLGKSKWKVIAFSSAHSGTANVPANAIDGNAGTRWHTDANTSVYPHFITVDMNFEWNITGFEIFRMTDDDRACDTFQLLVSTDNVTWVDLGVFNFNRLTNDGQFYEIPSHPLARYFKFVGLTGPQKYMVTGEISAYGM
jgi:hypothetical protein